MKFDLQTLKDAVGGTAAAFRCVTDYQPAGGLGIRCSFPLTRVEVATEKRIAPCSGKMRRGVLWILFRSQATLSCTLEEYKMKWSFHCW